MAAMVHRLFYAIVPSARERALIGLHREAIDGVTGIVANDRLHLTLAIVDDLDVIPAGLIDRLGSIGDLVNAEPFTLALDRLSGGKGSAALRPGHRSMPLSNLQSQVERGLHRLAVARPGWSFSPHVTLAYRSGAPISRPIQTIALTVNDFVLIHSHVGATRHEEVGRWPLATRQYALAL